MINPEETLSRLASVHHKVGSVPDGPWTTKEKNPLPDSFWTSQKGSVLDGSFTTQKRLWLPMAFGQIRRIAVLNDLWITQKSLYHLWLQDNPEEALSSFAIGEESSISNSL